MLSRRCLLDYLPGSGWTMVIDDELSTQHFSIKSEILHLEMSAELAGCLDMDSVAQLRTFLNRLSDDLRAGVVRSFQFDIAQLYLMSSSAISCFAVWIKHLSDHHPTSQVVFRTNHNLVWQHRALAPIRRVAERAVRID